MIDKNKIPPSWEVVKVGILLETIDGDRGPNYPKKDEFFDDGHCLFLSTKNVRVDRFLFEEKTFITKEKDEILRSGRLQLKDVVITTRGTLGNVALYDEKIPFKHIRINSGMLILRITNEILSNYFLMKFITSPIFISQLKEKQSGTAQPQIPANILREIEIPLPPLPEQHRIVSKIEELFSELDKGIESLTTAQQQLKIYRQAVLKWAFEGRLTHENVKDGELPEGWKLLKLKDITKEKDGLRRGPFGSAIKKEFFVADGYKVYEQGNAINDDPYRGKYFVDEKKYQELINFKLIPGDLIVSCSGVTL